MNNPNSYQKYLFELRRNPGTALVVCENRHYRAFDQDAWGVAARLERQPVIIDRHWTVDIQPEELEPLRAAFAQKNIPLLVVN